MSPTLAMVVERNANIKAFESTPFYNIVIEKDGATFSLEKIQDKSKAEEEEEEGGGGGGGGTRRRRGRKRRKERRE